MNEIRYVHRLDLEAEFQDAIGQAQSISLQEKEATVISLKKQVCTCP